MFKTLRDFGYPTDNRTYVIAEIGLNHGGDVDAGKRLIDAAAKAGADAVKFQTYLTEQRAPEGNQALFDLLKGLELPFAAFGELKAHADAQGVTFFSTPFDAESLAYLESIHCPLYKVASFDVVNAAFLRRVAATGKPVVMSVGMAAMDEVRAAVDLLEDAGPLSLLHCVSSYPLDEDKAELATLFRLRDAFPDNVVGYSDHTPGIDVPAYAVAAGAQVIEKHFKLDEAHECVDAPVSITAGQMAAMVGRIRAVEAMFGQGVMGVREVERGALVFRRPSN